MSSLEAHQNGGHDGDGPGSAHGDWQARKAAEGVNESHGLVEAHAIRGNGRPTCFSASGDRSAFQDMSRQASMRAIQLLLLQRAQNGSAADAAAAFGSIGSPRQPRYPQLQWTGISDMDPTLQPFRASRPMSTSLHQPLLDPSVRLTQESHLSPQVSLYLQSQALKKLQRQQQYFAHWPQDYTLAHGLNGLAPMVAMDSDQALERSFYGQNGSVLQISERPRPAAIPNEFDGTTGQRGQTADLPVCIAAANDERMLSRQQVLLRLQIEVFAASAEDVSQHVRGRNKSIAIGQVGMRCRHCAHLPAPLRPKGSTYFPATVAGLYQAGQNMGSSHIQSGSCPRMPVYITAQFDYLRRHKTTASGAGRQYWAQCAVQQLGLVDTVEGGIYHVRGLPEGVTIVSNKTKPMASS